MAFLRRLRRIIPAQATAAVMLADQDGETVRAVAVEGPLAAELNRFTFPLTYLPADLRTTFEERKPIVILDTVIASDIIGVDAWATLCREVPTVRGARFLGLLPLVWRETLVGAVLIRDDSSRAADPGRVHLLTLLADYLASALYTATATGEEAGRAQRLAMIERLVERISASPDVDRAIRYTLEEIGRTLGASIGLAWRGTTPDDLELVACWASAGVERDEALTAAPSAVERIALSNSESVAIADLPADPRIAEVEPGAVSRLDAAGVSSSLAAPFKLPRERIGVLTFHQIGRTRDWSVNDVELVTTLAEMIGDRAAEVVQSPAGLQPNVGLSRESGDSGRLRGLHQVATVFASRSDGDAVIREVVRAAISLVGGDRGALFRLEPDGELSLIQRWPMVDVAVADELPEEELAARVLMREQPLIVNPARRAEGDESSARFDEPRGVVAVPMSRGGRDLAALVVLSYDDHIRFGDDDSRLLGILGQLLAPFLLAPNEADRPLGGQASAGPIGSYNGILPPPAVDPFSTEPPARTVNFDPVTEYEAQSTATAQRDAPGVAARSGHDALERLRRGQRDFLTLVSHQFRTPLTGIQGFSEMMVNEQLSVEELRDYAADINQDARRLEQTLEEMLELARLESGQVALELAETDLNAVVQEVVDRVQVAARRSPVRLDLEDDMPVVAADRARLSEVVMRLLESAGELLPDEAEIVLGSRANCEYAHVSIRPEGIQLGAEALARLFDPFGDESSGPAAYIGGIRLGLPIVRQIVELHRGEAWAESETDGGTVFHFTMPLAGAASGLNDQSAPTE